MPTDAVAILSLCFLIVGTLYASVGHAGASRYLAVMALMGVDALTALSRFAEAEGELLRAEPVFDYSLGAPQGSHRWCMDAIITLYEAWNAAEPEAGCDAKANQWRQRRTALAGTRPE